MAHDYFIRIETYGTETPDIIDEEAMYQAERGMNYLNPDEYDYLCEADCIRDAEKYYEEELNRYRFDQYAEAMHP